MEGVEPPHVRPWHLRYVLHALAELRGMAVEELEAQTDENAVRLFGEKASRRASDA
jgi:Tat protein secretion system quality control protein TatD with DNase activity